MLHNPRSNDTSKPINSEKGKFSSIKSLVLNNTHVPWPAVTRLLNAMPNLNELHLSLNNYTSMDVGSEFPNILR